MTFARGSLILGINCAYHESAAALVRDGEVCFAVEEERLTRIKHAKSAQVTNPDELPWNAIRMCLAAGGAKLSDLDAIAFSLMPGRRLELIDGDPYDIADSMAFGTRGGEEEFNRRVLGIPRTLAHAAGDESLAARFHFVPHHRAHAASVFYPSPFWSAAVLVVDGIGETSTAWLGRGSPSGLELIEEVPYPHSIGMLWERVAVYLGFTEFDACKVMGLAAYGNAERFKCEYDRLFRMVDRDGGPPFLIDPQLARFRAGDVHGLELLFGPRRGQGERPDLARFADVAAGLQRRTEEAVLTLAGRLASTTGERALVYAGGVALNCVANARLERDGPFRSLHVLGAAHDAGTAIGAALEIAHSGDNGRRSLQCSLSAFLGPEYDDSTIKAALARSGYIAERVEDSATLAASLLADGLIVGWFQRRMEFGPRALGNRSLLADPRVPDVRERLNDSIKHRESFRPFGASVLAEAADDWFVIPDDRPGAFLCRGSMILAYPVRAERASKIPAVLHHDGTCRVQCVDLEMTPLFHELITRFRELTGVPLVLNTSFNDQEPLVATPEDALETFARSRIDALFLGDHLVRREQ